VMNPRVP